MAKVKKTEQKKCASVYVAQPIIKRGVIAKFAGFDEKEFSLFGVSEVNTDEGTVDFIPVVVFPKKHVAIDMFNGLVSPYVMESPKQKMYLARVEFADNGEGFIFVSSVGARVSVPATKVKSNFGEKAIDIQ